MRISDWSSDVCSSDLAAIRPSPVALSSRWAGEAIIRRKQPTRHARGHKKITTAAVAGVPPTRELVCRLFFEEAQSESAERRAIWNATRSEEHTSELKSLMRISYAVFCLKKKKKHTTTTHL